MEISKLWTAMLTRNLEHAGTDSSISLNINVGGAERLNHTFPDTFQEEQEKGQANLYEVNVEGHNIVPSELTNSSIRVGILGSDAWRPEHFMVWGERVSFLGTDIIPLAIETNITTQISTDSDEGPASFPLRLVGRGGRNMQINRLFMLMTTAGSSPDGGIIAEGHNTRPGTDSPLEIQVVSEGRLVVLFEIRDTTQNDLKAGGANFYSAPVITPFTKRSLNNDSITLRIKGLDDWEPSSFFLFGLDDASGRPESIVPLVHLPEWPHGFLKAESTTGVASVRLQLVQDRLAPADQVVFALNSVSSGQQKIISLLEKLVAKK